jgi:hypothetical protein
MQFVDRLLLDAPRRTSDGFMAVRAKSARVGTYDYLGSEIDPDNKHGLRDKGLVKVLRDEATVFDKAAVQSFIGKPVTDDHPTEAVTADNWRKHARGTVMGAIRDGDYVAFDLLLTDADAIAKVDAGKRELSNGYAAGIEFGDFTAPDGTKCVARQTSIRGNHVALVDQGRAGPECRISDAFAHCDAIPAALAAITQKEPVMAGNIIIDGLPVSLADEMAVRAVIEKKDKAIADAQNAVADGMAKLSEANGKVAALEKQLADAQAELAPAAIERRVADRAALVAQAKAIAPDLVTDGKTDADIRRAVVTAKLGDKCPADDAGVAGAFSALAVTKDATPVVHNLAPAKFADTATVRDTVRAARYA